MTKSVISALLPALLLTACAAQTDTADTNPCTNASKIGRFDPSKDLFLAHFDIKTDTDDLHSAAAVATMLASPGFECVNYRAVSGTYGTQGGEYVDPENIFKDAFGKNWVDAHGDREAAVTRLASDVAGTLSDGGHVWIMEGGQSDVSAAIMRAVKTINADTPMNNIHVVQHSDWNEKVTSPEALDFAKGNGKYFKIPDGNAVGNGTPGFRTEDPSAWPALLGHPDVGPIWRDVQKLALAKNGGGHDDETIAASGYDNKAIGAGGLDFSDTAEAMWIFGYEHLVDEKDFVRVFVNGG